MYSKVPLSSWCMFIICRRPHPVFLISAAVPMYVQMSRNQHRLLAWWQLLLTICVANTVSEQECGILVQWCYIGFTAYESLVKQTCDLSHILYTGSGCQIQFWFSSVLTVDHICFVVVNPCFFKSLKSISVWNLCWTRVGQWPLFRWGSSSLAKLIMAGGNLAVLLPTY